MRFLVGCISITFFAVFIGAALLTESPVYLAALLASGLIFIWAMEG